MSTSYDLDKAIRRVPDFPKPGILFYDITSVLMDPAAFGYCLDRMKDIYRDRGIEAVAAVEARGFIFGSAFARDMGLPLILVRKAGKLPGETRSRSYSLEYGEASVEVHREDIPRGKNVLIVDDLLATGGTLKATAELLEEGGAQVKDIFGVIGLPFLPYPQALEGYRVETLIEYEGE